MLKIFLLITALQFSFLTGATFDVKGEKFHIQFPETWNVQTNFSSEIDLVANSRSFNGMLYVHVDTSPPLSSKGLLLQYMTDLLRRYPLAKVVYQGQEPIEGRMVQWIIYTNTIANKDITVMEYYLVGNNNAYIVGMLATPQDFRDAQPHFQRVVQTFQTSK